MIWLAVDGTGKIHGSFKSLTGKHGFNAYAAKKPHPVPWTLVQVQNGNPQASREVVVNALFAAQTRMPL